MTGETVRTRFETARAEVGTREIVVGVAVAAALVFALAFLQQPLVHDSLHGFRHGAGITCH